MTLDEIRQRIDELDTNLIHLLGERAKLVHMVGDFKKEHGLPIYAPERECSLIEKLLAKNKEAKSQITEDSLKAIYREIMSAALSLEDDFKVAYLGPEGTWTHQAAIKKFGHSIDYIPKSNFADVFDAVESKQVNYGVVPIENSTEGAVTNTLDLFVESHLKICAQIELSIQNALLAKIDREDIKVIYSHPQVFGQCRGWLLQNFPKADLVEVSSTTKAAQIAAQAQSSDGAAALAGTLSAEFHELNILESNIQDKQHNTTRFLVITHKGCPVTGDDKTSLLFSVKDQPGSLVNALNVFNNHGINLAKIESRPSKQGDWKYVFYVDAQGHAEESPLREALLELEASCALVKVLGSYSRKSL